jgi:hypothetical protein
MAKSKFREVYCSSCKKETRMVILKAPENNKGWFECTRCHHSYYIDLLSIESEKKDEKDLPPKEDCIPYSPERKYSIGDPIYHVEWDDIGKVEAKVTMSSGKSAIRVKFQKGGLKKLVENFQPESALEEGEKIEQVNTTETVENSNN